jgi:hypothetical protein
MDYTLFIDESGHFGRDEDESEDWIVGGVLCPTDPETAEKTIGNGLNPIPSEYGLSGRNDLHRTDLNRRALSGDADWDFERIGALTRALFGRVLEASPDAQFLAVRNPSQRGLSDPEETYRLMVLDLIALADSVLPPAAPVDHLRVCAATRTDAATGRMTTRAELAERLPGIVRALEVDLASRGLMDLLSEKDLLLRPQPESWLLTVADFWCNAVYNREQPESGAVVDALLDHGTGRVFTTWSDDPRVRRALVAERDGNYGLALFRWSALPSSTEDSTRAGALERLCDQITSRPRSSRPTFEQAIEMLWRRFGKKERYGRFIDALRQIETAVTSVAENLPSAEALLFRIRNMIHLAANRDGRTDIASTVGATQKETAAQIGYDPEHVSLILDAQLHRIHTLHHNLDFAAGLEEAEMHRERVQEYGALWDLLGDDREHSFEASRMNLKAEMTWMESRIWAARPDDALDDVLTQIEDLKALSMAAYDRSRLLNYSILGRLKRGWWDGALTESMRALEHSTDQYAVAHAARAAATAVLHDDAAHGPRAETIYDRVRETLPGDRMGAFPALARRDRALLAYILHEDAQTARSSLERGRDALTWSPGDRVTPIRRWVSWTFDLTGQFVSEGDDMQAEVPSEFHGVLPDTDVLRGSEGLLFARRVSPY